MMSTGRAKRHRTVIIGAGQAGLSVGYHLRRLGEPFIILDANERIGDSWRQRWDSLRLFTPGRYNGLDGMRFPGRDSAFPTKDEMGDYLEAYATRFDLPVRTATRVTRLARRGRTFVLEAGGTLMDAENVVVAMSTFQRPIIPAFARELDPAIVQLHSSEYRNPSQLRDGPVLIAGAATSGAEIGVELAATHRTWLAGRDVGQLPFRIDGAASRLVLGRLVLRVLFHRVLTVSTPVGRRLRPKLVDGGGPLVRIRSAEVSAAGIERVPRVAGVRDGLPLLADDRLLDVANVIWCTGFDPGFSWIELPILDDRGQPRHERGIAHTEPGLFFVGLHFLYAMSSTMIHGVGRDARRIADAIAARASAEQRARAAAETPAMPRSEVAAAGGR